MKTDDIGNVLIMDGDQLTGIITDRDIVIRPVVDGQDVNTAVSTSATKDVFTLPCSTSVQDAARAMAERQLRCLPVTDSQIGGIVSLADLSNRTSGNADQGVLEGISKPG